MKSSVKNNKTSDLDLRWDNKAKEIIDSLPSTRRKDRKRNLDPYFDYLREFESKTDAAKRLPEFSTKKFIL
jgi:hypothetical protein